MPSHGILNQQLTAGSDGFATILGQVTGVNTSAFSPGDTVYVGSSGGYTNVKPTGSTNLIQNLGVVKKVDASNGTGEIFGSGRTNDVPNLPTGKIWVGATDYTVTSSVIHLDEPNSRLGIGTTSPSAKLHVKGSGSTSATTALLVEDSSGTDLLEVNDQGNVSIPNGSLSLNGATNLETFNILGNMTFDGGGTISGGGVGDSLYLSAAGANISIGGANSNIVMTGGVSGSFSGSFEGDGSNLTGITAEWDGSLNGDAEITGSLTIKAGDLLVSGSNSSTLIGTDGEIELGYDAQPVKLNRNKFVLVNSGPDVVASVDANTFLSAHFDYVIVKGTNLRAGTVMACHDGQTPSTVVFTETSTNDIGSTLGVDLGVQQTGSDLELVMSVPSTGWYIKTFVRAI